MFKILSGMNYSYAHACIKLKTSYSAGVGDKGESLGTDESLIWVIHRYLQASMNLE